METTFSVLTAPLQKFFKNHSAQIDKESDSRKLKFTQFTLTMLYSFMMQKESFRKISNHLKNGNIPKSLGLSYIPWTTLRDGFTRFSSDYFMCLYRSLLTQTRSFLHI